VTSLRGVLRQVEVATLRLLRSDRSALLLVVKATFAAAAAFELARETVGSTVPALAAMAGIITVQVSVAQTVRRAVEYSVGVAAGFIFAILLTRVMGLHWWSLALLVFLALLVGRLIRLGSQANQVAISALLVMSLGSSYGWSRVVDSLIGSGVGMLTNFFVPSPSPWRTLEVQIRSAAAEIGTAVRLMATTVRSGWTASDARTALGIARAVSRSLAEPRAEVESQRDELRVSLSTRRRSEAGLRLDRTDAAVTALDHVTNEVRSVGRGLLALAEDAEHSLPAALHVMLADLLDGIAHCLDSWSTAAGDGSTGHVETLRAALQRASASQSAFGCEIGSAPPPVLAGVMVDVERIRGELDPEGAHAAALLSLSAAH
jgi:uncharacterized membrane protein YgaE (UPF0421/DUF939 family)